MNNPGGNGEDGGNQSRMFGAVPSAPYYGQRWQAGGAGNGNYLPQPPIPIPVPYPGGGGGGYQQFGYPPAPPNSVTGAGMYPNIGFNPALLNPTASSVTCPNAAEGCSEVIPGHLLTSHLKVCEFRSFPFCSKYFGWTDCHEKVARSTLVRHLCDNHQVVETQHAKFSLKLIAPFQLLHNQKTPPSSSSSAPPVQQDQGVVWSPLVIKSDMLDGDHVLLKCFISPRGYLSLAGYLLESSGRSNTEWKSYRVKFQLESLSKIARLEWTGRLIFHRFHDHDADTGTGIHPSGQFASNVNTFRIPVSTLIQEYIKPVGGGGAAAAGNSLEKVDYHHHPTSSSKIKVKVCVWKHNGDDAEPPYKKCFQEEESLEKLTLFSSEQGGGQGSRAFALTADELDDYHQHHHHHHHDPHHFYASPRMAPASAAAASAPAIKYSQEEYSNYYSLDSRCSHCSRHLYGDVIYQCLQCHSDSSMVATYFCRNCIEGGNFHGEHLTMRISKPSLQPLAAVAYECSAGELH